MGGWARSSQAQLIRVRHFVLLTTMGYSVIVWVMVSYKKIMKVLSRKNGHHSSRKSKLEGMLNSLTALNIACCYQRRCGNHWSRDWFDEIDKVELILKRSLARA